MQFLPTALAGVIIVEPNVFRDERGFFLENYHALKFQEGGIGAAFIPKTTIRNRRAARCAGFTLSARNTRKASWCGPLKERFSMSRWTSAGVLPPSSNGWGSMFSAANFRMLYLPPGFAHGFCVTSDRAQVQYKCTDFYDPGDEISLRWDDPELAIEWPVPNPALSARDQKALTLRQLYQQLPLYQPE